MTGSAAHFVAPPFEEPWTGGTLYNARLFDALRRAGQTCERLDVAAVKAGNIPDGARSLWVDSLYLDAVRDIASANPNAAVRLFLHYLPSLVREDRPGTAADLTREERAALRAAQSFVTTSAWLASVLVEAGVDASRIGIVEPGIVAPTRDRELAARGRPHQRPLRALMVANLLPGKGVLKLLEALAAHRDPLHVALTIVGSDSFDRGHADLCFAAARASKIEIRWAGPLAHDGMLALMTESDVFVSASRMESFGMALAEARASGLPILARRGGNVAAHVEESAGGSLFDEDVGLVAALALLSVSPVELARRTHLASLGIRQRPWENAARDFLQVVSAQEALRGVGSV